MKMKLLILFILLNTFINSKNPITENSLEKEIQRLEIKAISRVKETPEEEIKSLYNKIYNKNKENNKEKNDLIKLITKNSEAYFTNSKLSLLKFNNINNNNTSCNHKEIFILKNNDKENFLNDGSFLMFPWVGRINNNNYLKNFSQILAENFPFKDPNGFPLHGFLASLPRKIIKSSKNSVTFSFIESNIVNEIFKFFPKIIEKYTLFENKLILELEFENLSNTNNQFFNYGYHPYFQFDINTNDNNNNNETNINLINEFKLHSNLIEKEIKLQDKYFIPEFNKENSFIKKDYSMQNLKIKDLKFDTLFEINSNKKEDFKKEKLISLINEKNKNIISLDFDNKLNDFYTKENFIEIKFIQIFTPDDRNRIAIEPMTNPSNSLNFSKENFEKYNIKIKPKQKLYSNFIIEFN